MAGEQERYANRPPREPVGRVIHVVGHVTDIRYSKANNGSSSDDNFVEIQGRDGHKYRAFIRRNAPFMQIANRNGFQASTWNTDGRLRETRNSLKGTEWKSDNEKHAFLKKHILDKKLELLFKIVTDDRELLGVLSPIYSDITIDIVKPIMADLFPNMEIENVREHDGVFGGKFRGRVASAQGIESFISVDATKLEGNVGLRLYSDIRMEGILFTIKETELLKEKGQLTSVFWARPFHTGDSKSDDVPRLKDALQKMAASLNDVYGFVTKARDTTMTLDERKRLLSYYGQFFSKKIGQALAHHEIFTQEGPQSLYNCARVFAKLAFTPGVATGVVEKLQGYAGEMVVLGGLPDVLNNLLIKTNVNADLWKNT